MQVGLTGSVDDKNVVFTGRIDIDVVDSSAGTSNKSQSSGGTLDNRSRHFGRRSHNQRVVLFELVDEIAFWQFGAMDDGEAGGTQSVHALRLDVVGDEHRLDRIGRRRHDDQATIDESEATRGLK